MAILYTRVDWFENRRFLIKFHIKLHISEELIVPIATF